MQPASFSPQVLNIVRLWLPAHKHAAFDALVATVLAGKEHADRPFLIRALDRTSQRPGGWPEGGGDLAPWLYTVVNHNITASIVRDMQRRFGAGRTAEVLVYWDGLMALPGTVLAEMEPSAELLTLAISAMVAKQEARHVAGRAALGRLRATGLDVDGALRGAMAGRRLEVVNRLRAELQVTPVAVDVPGLLHRGQAAIDAGDVESALTMWITAWAQTGDAGLGDLIDGLADRVEPKVPPPAKTLRDTEAGWASHVAGLSDGARVPYLLAPWPPAWRLALDRLHAVSDRPNPVLARRLLDLMRAYSSVGAYAFRVAAAKFVATCGDGRLFDAFVALRLDADPSTLDRDRSTLSGQDYRRALKEPPPLDLSQLALPKSAIGLETLYHAVYGAPDDLSARLVLADALTERGNPRGEYIALACAGADVRRQASLERKHRRAWGPEQCQPAQTVFERGFAVQATLRSEAPGQVLSHPSWSTVHTLWWGAVGRSAAELQAVLDSPSMAGLSTWHGLLAPGLSGVKVDRLREVSLVGWRGDGDWSGVRGLTRLTLTHEPYGYRFPVELPQHPFWECAHITIGTSPESLAAARSWPGHPGLLRFVPPFYRPGTEPEWEVCLQAGRAPVAVLRGSSAEHAGFVRAVQRLGVPLDPQRTR